MEATFHRVCAEHDLRSVSVMLFTQHKSSPITVYIHWDEPGAGNCASGNGNTFDEAIAVALVQMAERRQITEAA
ncbi:hypothetical protein [Aminobacter sp. MDW-2]|uniref:hypothetical protein n=1 Tax=Aminobacter sp. MDW-2 TaxID=2666139 RepID=UPI0012B04BA6|nr:hypothetical protein [Aminobacter sp. MDW-2]MRX33182.1 hypothetical protein [Aminobacter sp. MDW-2]QNH36807.1 hypothetical protein H5P29_13425 [Aminobacter sp. MDW-2]